MKSELSASVIISTYNQPLWLRKTLWSLLCQSHRDFDVIIGDDGSGPETKAVIDEMQDAFAGSIRHVWHDDDGFRKNMILNAAVRHSDADYLILIDGDIVARRDFIANHLALARQNRFLSGGCIRLERPVSDAISRDDIEAGRPFSARWLCSHGQPINTGFLKLLPYGPMSRLLDTVSPTQPTFNGMNSSLFREDFYRVNGFDERMAYGGCDRELGERLENAGIAGRQARYSLTCVHLDHGRPYVRNDLWEKNKSMRLKVRRDGISRTDHGIV